MDLDEESLTPDEIATSELDDELIALLDQLEEDPNAGLTDTVDAYDGCPCQRCLMMISRP